MGFTSSAVTCINGICTNGMNCVHCGMPVEREERYSLSGFHSQRLCNECRSLAIDLYQHGERPRGIAREMGINPAAVRTLLIREGLVDGAAYREGKKRRSRAYRERHLEDTVRSQRDYRKTERRIADNREYYREYRKTEKRQVYMREYYNTEEYKAHSREYMHEYRKTEGYKAYHREYRKTEKHKAYRREYMRESRKTEGYKAYKREYNREYRKKQKELRSSQHEREAAV